MNIGIVAFILIALFLIGSVYTLKVVSKNKKSAPVKEKIEPTLEKDD